MADEISTKTLSILLVVAIAISLGGTFFSLNRLSTLMGGPKTTGYVNNAIGSAQVNITATGSIRYSVWSLDFGLGSVNTSNGNQYCSMASGNGGGFKDDNSRCIDFENPSTFNSLEIENDGSKNLTITLSADSGASVFIGGTSPQFLVKVTNNESNSCPTPQPAGWGIVNNSEDSLCPGSGLGFEDNADSIDIHLNITIPYNSRIGMRVVALTATGTPVE